MNNRVLIVGTVWPLRRHSAASARSLSLVEGFLNHGFDVTYSSECAPDDGMAQLQTLGVKTSQHLANSPTFDELVIATKPNIVLFDRFMTEEKFSWRVRQHCPSALLVLDTIDLHSLRRARQQALKANITTVSHIQDILSHAGDILMRELASILRSDVTVLTSDVELDLLTSECNIPHDLLKLCRLTYPLPAMTRPYSERKGFACIGNFRHPPNVDGIIWLRDHIWPKIRKQDPDATMDVWGAFPAKEHFALSQSKNGFVVRGEATDQFEVMSQCRVNLAPLRFGAGIKGKIADAWWCGTPTVTTSVGAEGMHGEVAFAGVVSDDPESFAQAALDLYRNESFWTDTSQKSTTMIESLFSVEATVDILIRDLASAVSQLETRRCENIVGQVLWHQTLRSTEFFSRWIELKEDRAKPSVTPPLLTSPGSSVDQSGSPVTEHTHTP